jgi:hypothetical protein
MATKQATPIKHLYPDESWRGSSRLMLGTPEAAVTVTI